MAYDAIIVLGGGGQRGPRCTDLPLWVCRRLDRAAELFHQTNPEKAPQVILLSAGTPHRPNYVDTYGFPVLESTSAAEYLRVVHSVPCRSMWRESTSLDTIGNAYFLRTSYLDPAEEGRFQSLCVITSSFHMQRTRAVFDWILCCSPSSSHCATGDGAMSNNSNGLSSVSRSEVGSRAVPYVVRYMAVGDEGVMGDEALAERRCREETSLKHFHSGIEAALQPLRDAVGVDKTEGKKFLAAVQNFVLTEHQAYCVHDHMMVRPPVGSVTSTY